MTRARAIRLCRAAALSLAGLLALPAHAAAVPNVYVNNNGSGNVSQYDITANGTLAAKSPATVTAGTNPYIGIAVSPDGQSAYVANQGDPGVDDVSQFDVAANGALSPKTPATVDAGMDPSGIAISPDGDSAYVVNNGSNTVSQYDVAADGTLTAKSTPTVATGTNPFQIAITPDGESAYVTNGGTDNNVSQYDIAADGTLSAKTPATEPAGVFPFGIVISPDGSSAYVTNISSSNISQFDVDPDDGTLSAKSTPTVSAGTFPRGIAITPDGSSVYAANGGTNQATSTVSQYDVDPDDGELTPKTTATVPADSNPFQIAIGPAGESAYVTNFDSAKISQYDIDPDDGELAAMTPATVAAGTQPAGIAVRPDTIGPRTTINSGPSGTVGSPNARFTFSANEPGSSFRCRLDGGAFSSCSSPKVYGGVADGIHGFSVRATDPWDNTGPTATRNWTIDTSEPPPPPPTPPSNEFSFGDVKKNKKKGTAKLTVIVPGPGALELEGKKVKDVTEEVGGAAARGAQPDIEAKLKVKAAGKAKKKLKQKGKAKVKADVTYTPTGGDPNTQGARVKLVKK